MLRCGILSRSFLSRTCVRTISKSSPRLSEPEEKVPSSVATTFKIQNLAKSDVPIEKRSLSRGLALNKFEKDFLIYPEYHDTDDVRSIEGYVNSLKESLSLSVDSKAMEKTGELSESLKLALDKNAIYSVFVPAEFGGLGMNHKDRLKIFEELSVDWSLYSTVNVTNTVSNLLVLYGNDEQKEKYLPLIAQGKCRPGIAVVDTGDNTPVPEIVGHSSGHGILSGKVKVLNGQNANLIVLFASSSHHLTKQRDFSFYILDRTQIGSEAKWETTRRDTLGLKAFEVCELDLAVPLSNDNILGEEGQGADVLNEVASCSRLPLAAATVGFAKRLIGDMATMCNQTPSQTTTNGVLSDDTCVQRAMTHLATKVYALESATYYLGGLIDESLPIVVDIENALLHRLTRDVLRTSVSTTVELFGLQAADKENKLEQMIRDVSSLMAMNGEGNSVERIAMATLSSWAAASHKKVTSSLKRFFGAEKTLADMKDPKLTHYIAEHAHPSLQMACQELEFSMSRINTVISKMVAEQGKNIEADYGSLENLVQVLHNNLIMVAVIARASRSYAVGLRNADIELAWATTICTRLSRESWFELESLGDYFGLVKLNPSLLNAGRAVLDMGGYKVESPLERNW